MPISFQLLQGLGSRNLISQGYTTGFTSLENLIEPIKFCGATVKDIFASQGLNENVGSVTINLVEDTVNGDVFIEPSGGTPQSIVCGSFRFDGLVQDVTTNKSMDGYPVYTVMLQNPVALLDGTQIIIDGFMGSVSGVPNLINVFSYWETLLGYGGSFNNSLGMYWNYPAYSFSANISGQINLSGVGFIGLKPGLENIINLGLANENFGKVLQLAGHTYKVDFDSIHTGIAPPTIYRLPGPHMSLLDMVTYLYEDSGYDYLVDLTLASGTGPHTISFRSISRRTQPDLTAVQAYLNSQSGYVMSTQYGKEFRNEPTSYYLTGAYQETLQDLNSSYITPYWGQGLTGEQIVGTTPNLPMHTIPDISTYLGLGGYYPINMLEIRYALADYDSWACYVTRNRFSGVALPLGIASRAITTDSPVEALLADFVADDAYTAALFSDGPFASGAADMSARLYQFVRGYGEEYYGKKFLVRMPIISQVRIDPDTNNIIYSYEPTSSAYLAEGSTPLGLDYYNELMFLDQQGKFTPFVRFDNPEGIDFTQLSSANSLIQSDTPNNLFSRANLDDRPIYDSLLGNTYVVMTLAEPAFEVPDSIYGDVADLATGLNTSTGYVISAIDYFQEDFPLRISPAAVMPSAVAIPVRSNISRYGPWGYGGAPGKTQFEIDENLAPWNFGSYTLMNSAALTKVQNAYNYLQNYEKGSVQIPGLPELNMGDVLYSGGPTISNMTIRLGVEGYSTEVQMNTFSPRFGVFNRDKQERLQKMGQGLRAMNERIRYLGKDIKEKSDVISNRRSPITERFSRSINQQSPHSVLVGHSVPLGTGYASLVSVQKMHESVANCRGANSAIFSKTSVASLESVLRPFSTNTQTSGISHYAQTDAGVGSNLISRSTLNPFKTNNDFQWFSWGQTYGRLNRRNHVSPNMDDARFFGLRGPMILTGWGYSTNLQPFPNSSGYTSGVARTGMRLQDYSSSFIENYENRSDLWPTGPVDLRWCPIRGVWTAPPVFFGTAATGIPVNGSGQVILNGFTNHRIWAYDFFGTAIPSGRKVVATYDSLAHRYWITSAACS